jgi:serine/threonine protein phosphatase PrpC
MLAFQDKSSMDSCVRGLCKNQDVVFTGISNLRGEPFNYGIVMDGHGSDEFISFMKRLDWTCIVSCDDVWENIYSILMTNNYLTGGSTLIVMRAFINRIEVISVGDSVILIHKNGELSFTNEKHTHNNFKEKERLKTITTYQGIKKPKDYIPIIRNSNEMQATLSYYNYFGTISYPRSHHLAMTQCLGHGNITGYEPERHIEYFEENDSMHILMGSDGLFDMLLLKKNIQITPDLTPTDLEDIQRDQIDILTMNATELVEKVEKRWKKCDWIYHWHNKDYSKIVYPLSFEGVYDDICAIIWKNK